MTRLLLAYLFVVQAIFSVERKLVIVPVTVTDERGVPVKGLAIDDFMVQDNGRRTTIEVFTHGDVQSSLGLLIDHSQSMQPHLSALVRGVQDFIDTRPAEDELFALTFNERVHEVTYSRGLFALPRDAFPQALVDTLPSGQTALFDAVAFGLDRLERGGFARKALLVITDGADTVSQMSLRQLQTRLLKTSATVYLVGMPSSEWSSSVRRTLDRLCMRTGGRSFFPAAGEDSRALLTDIRRELSTQYTLGVVPRGDSREPRALDVRVTSPGRKFRIRARQAYVP